MKYRLFLVSLLSGGLLVSCQSSKTGGDEDLLADNGGYSEGGFYGDSSHPAPPGYPRDGEDLTTSGGVPFGHNDPVDHVEPVVAEVAPIPAPAPRPGAPAPLVASRPAVSDPYETAYADNGSYGSDHGAERAVVTPYVERATPVTTTTAASKATTKTSSNKVVAGGSAKKKSPTVASSGGTRQSTTKVSGKKSGTTVKTVYHPPGKGKSATKKKATVVRVHDVKRGDSLSKLASRYGVTVAHLKKRNKLTSDTIVLGKRLTID